MLSTQDNELLTRVGPGTPMGELLRRYWTPALLVSEAPTPDSDPVRVRLLGENLVAFRDTTGRLGLVGENCPHRGASLFFGRNEECGLRCPYHGWKFDADGACVDMPSEPPTSVFKDKVRIKAYPTHESGGIVWTYMGPADKQPPFRDFGTEKLAPDQVAATKLHTTCNWVQAMEGNLDTSHISWLHQWNGVDDIPDDGSDKPGYPTNAMSWKFWKHDRAPRLEIEDTWYGFKYVGIRDTPNGYTHVRMSAFCYPYNTVIASVPFNTQHGLFVPADDENTWRYSFATRDQGSIAEVGGENLFSVSPFEFGPAEVGRNGIIPRRYTAANDYGIDRAEQRTSTYSGVREFISQDFMVTESMGPIYDRTQERLGTSDKAIIRMRRLLLAAAKRVAAGGDAPAVDGDLDYRSIRSAEKILEDGEDWRHLGTDDDPMVQLYERGAAATPVAGS
ncbi:Rieske 2Fe-2S domain-containing protein [Pseudonocardia sp. TRM90224]|uniref:Rieske 2Fe-2S domain-containing protein n=1 Tax=Pseudonocardia sp. TRM90224 TaxID=2812678 RepID=UPI001E635A4C|nr:Rieske 2Fe-2S domain-containing protein [Pseudonocardia sp. TRM90224]